MRQVEPIKSTGSLSFTDEPTRISFETGADGSLTVNIISRRNPAFVDVTVTLKPERAKDLHYWLSDGRIP